METTDLLWVIIPLFMFLDTIPAMFISVLLIGCTLAQDPKVLERVESKTTEASNPPPKHTQPVPPAPIKTDKTEWN